MCKHHLGLQVVSTPTRSKALVELIKLGQINEPFRPKSDRLSLTENCSLLIKNLSAEDAGLYTCRQFNSRGQLHVPDAPVLLSVVTSEYSLHHVFISTSEPLWFIFLAAVIEKAKRGEITNQIKDDHNVGIVFFLILQGFYPFACNLVL